MIYEWAVIGAGPAGIAAIGKLIDYDVTPNQITWIDPEFLVGDFGTLWCNIPSNTKVKLFKKFLTSSPAFNYSNCPHDFEINHLNPEETCLLRTMAEPLQWVSDQLGDKVNQVKNHAEKIWLENCQWNIQCKNGSLLRAKKVILAVGSTPKKLSNSALPIIPLQDAMDNDRVHKYINCNDTVAVFGSSHSAILVLRNLVENKVKRIINFYRNPLRYAIYLDNWILFDDTGLKGSAAQWAREHIDGKLPDNLIRVYSNSHNVDQYLLECTKIVYAIGFERRHHPIIQNFEHVDYVEQCGVIAPGLFGVGIAFPEAKRNKIGMVEYRVGLWKFMEFLHDMIPVWLKYSA